MEVGAGCCGCSEGGSWRLKSLESDVFKLGLRMNRQLERAWSVSRLRKALQPRVLQLDSPALSGL